MPAIPARSASRGRTVSSSRSVRGSSETLFKLLPKNDNHPNPNTENHGVVSVGGGVGDRE